MSDEIIFLPAFAAGVLKTSTCKYCQSNFSPKDVCCAGVRRDVNGKTYFSFEVNCSVCAKTQINIIKNKPCNMSRMANYILESYNSYDENENSQFEENNIEKSQEPPIVKKKSKMKESEIREMMDFMKKNTDHESFLRFIGANLPEEKEDKNENK